MSEASFVAFEQWPEPTRRAIAAAYEQKAKDAAERIREATRTARCTCAAPGRDALRDDVLDALTGTPQSATAIAKAVGRHPKDGTVRRLLADLQAEGLAQHGPGGWGGASLAPLGDGTPGTPQGNGFAEPNEGGATGGANFEPASLAEDAEAE